ncbi:MULTISPECIES: hypothetical protein [unclassified Bacillus (in: firmicutes)]|uniref:hypothetical protein n=1 Tax=unclassified Bacillus (in: firmicutes) TaxID=185979 RepID=UPI001BE6AE0E|nr:MULTISPECIES: hypothetical protein [unclassified Bacillus (in: firmicutes)]MBT2614097.1 hypothetical protein [Bacillus sp. ISL-78]MBT2629392.1 hypothetical protein [Bacillus sp. ISL-101]
MSKVTVWYMTEEERLAYIEKHPIVPSEEKPNKSGAAFSDIFAYGERRKKLKGGERTENKI